jgi:predicted TIM-barrel fold metal-dependent hydrolase
MSANAITSDKAAAAGLEGFPIIDCDVHSNSQEKIVALLPERWKQYVDRVGVRCFPFRGISSGNGSYRLDTFPPSGGPGSDPEFAREQLLDEYGVTAAVLNTITYGTGNIPNELATALMRAANEFNQQWLDSDERWRAAINVNLGDPASAVAEIERCRGISDRYVQVLVDPNSERPAGNPAYWPIYEAAEAMGIPIGIHIVAKSKDRLETALGQTTYYYELRTALDILAQTATCSLIFEGVFDRFPNLQVGLIETDWTWVVPMAWRLDATWRVQKDEIPNLQRRPSEYFREHFWHSTQPMLETERPEQIYEAFDQLESNGFGERLMFATDYPHWDMDSPFETIPARLSDEAKWRLLGGNASKLYGIDIPSLAASL